MITERNAQLYLIISGNDRINTFGNTLRGVAERWKDKGVKEIQVVNTLASSAEPWPNWRDISFELLPGLQVYQEVRLLNETDFISQLPAVFRRLLSQRRALPQEIIVDMTNGTKTWCDFMFLLCTILRIENIFRVRVPFELHKLPYNDVPIHNVVYTPELVLDLPALRSTFSSIYAEYVAYFHDVKQFTDWVDNSSCLSCNATELNTNLFNSFEQYVKGDYAASIIQTARVAEELLKQLLSILPQKWGANWVDIAGAQAPPGTTMGTMARYFADACDKLSALFENRKNSWTNSPEGRTIKSRPEFVQFLPLLPLGHLYVSISHIRNAAAHHTEQGRKLTGEQDARQVLRDTLYILEKVQECTLLSRQIGES